MRAAYEAQLKKLKDQWKAAEAKVRRPPPRMPRSRVRARPLRQRTLRAHCAACGRKSKRAAADSSPSQMGKDLRREIEAQKSRRVAAETRIRQADSRIESLQEMLVEKQQEFDSVCNAKPVSSS